MLKNIRIKQLSNTGDCLRWSADGTLAVVAGEDVVILVPRFRSDGSTKRSQQFWHTQAKTRELIVAVMDDEVEPADPEVYSIGEEQGPGYAKAVAWSPMGVSRHARCVLAMLTTNHIVHVFVPCGHPGADWRPLHNLCAAMDKYSAWPVEEVGMGGADKEERIRRRMRSRARSVAWSLACRRRGEIRGWGESLLAVANEHAEVVFFRVTAETANAVGHLQPFSGAEVRRIVGTQSTFLRTLAWSPWNEDGHAFLAYSFQGKVYISDIKMSFGAEDNNDPPQVEVVGEPMMVGEAPTDKHPVHCIAWAPEIVDGRIVLAYAVQRRVSVVVFSSSGETIVSTEDYKNDFIESLTGLCFAPSAPSTLTLQLLSSHGRSQLIKFKLSPTPKNPSTSHIHDPSHVDTPPAPPATATDQELRDISCHWQTALAELKQDFMGEYDLPSAAIRAYGLATSPLGGTTVVAASFHPDDTPEYITAANEKMVLVFGTHEGVRGSWRAHNFAPGALPTPYDLAPEALLIEILALGDPLLSTVSAAVAATPADKWDTDASLATTFTTPSLNATRYNSLISHIYPSTISAIPPRLPDSPALAAAAVAAVLRRTPYDTNPAAMRLLYSMATVGVLGLYTSAPLLHLARSALLWLATNTPEHVRFDLELGVIAMRLAPGEGASRLAVERGIVSSMETCVLCGAGMVWRDLEGVECTAGHRWSRCARTWLPVTDPRGTRECGICSGVVMDRRGEVGHSEGLLAEVEDEWTVCLTCGGRFWAEES
ncbi:transcription factor IIIC subunit delta N-term-domain-containing protein [Geopyxis carbonaria]|nr:transcription factor IIIC subunit delta N-term-domain-containing protein [Geopyxis carbonaria]